MWPLMGGQGAPAGGARLGPAVPEVHSACLKGHVSSRHPQAGQGQCMWSLVREAWGTSRKCLVDCQRYNSMYFYEFQVFGETCTTHKCIDCISGSQQGTPLPVPHAPSPCSCSGHVGQHGRKTSRLPASQHASVFTTKTHTPAPLWAGAPG